MIGLVVNLIYFSAAGSYLRKPKHMVWFVLANVAVATPLRFSGAMRAANDLGLPDPSLGHVFGLTLVACSFWGVVGWFLGRAGRRYMEGY